jgi:hypothetical protein
MKIKYRKQEVSHRSVVAKLLREYRLQQSKVREVQHGRR